MGKAMKEAGYIYILKHKNGQTVKVGVTKRSSEERFRSYVSQYDLKNFTLYKDFQVPVRARNDIEKIAHQKLSSDRLAGIAGAREIFACTTEKAEKAILEAINESSVNREELAKELRRKRLEEKKIKEEKKRIDAREKFYLRAEKKWETLKEKKLLDRQLEEINTLYPEVINMPKLWKLNDVFEEENFTKKIIALLVNIPKIFYFFMLVPVYSVCFVAFFLFFLFLDSSQGMKELAIISLVIIAPGYIYFFVYKRKEAKNFLLRNNVIEALEIETKKDNFLEKELKTFDKNYKSKT